MFIGAHVSTAGGIDTAVARATAIGAECVQIFGGPPQTYRASTYSDDQVASFIQKAHDAGLGPTWFHGIYLINLASEKPETVARSIGSLTSYLELCARIEGAGVLFHTGSHGGRGLAVVLDQIVAALHEVLDTTPPTVWLCLENSAGQGGSIGSDFAELGQIVRAVAHPRLGVCLDTQHAFAAGYDVSTREGVHQMFDTFDREVGLDRLRVMHLNDSKTDLGSHVDRHQNIGEGKIGLAGFAAILSHPAVKALPLDLEVPGEDGKSGPDAANLDRLKALREE